MIKSFKNKKEVFIYLIKKFILNEGTILLRGSMINEPVKDFCDFDLEIYTNKKLKPYYEIVFVNKKICLISIWFGKYRIGSQSKMPKKVKLIHGNYFSYMKGLSDKRSDSQHVIDWVFKYIRTKNMERLDWINKKIN
jgi:hypothetical protein